MCYENSIPKGRSVKKHVITQIAPTLSILLNIILPSTSNRNPIEEIFKDQELINLTSKKEEHRSPIELLSPHSSS